MKDGLPSDLTVEYQPVAALKAFSRNARTHSKRQVHQIAESIKTFGFTNPILIDRANTIIAGHGRFAAAKLLGMERVLTIRLEGLTEAQLQAYVIADNRLAERAGWDKSILRIELQHLITINNFDVTVTGFEVAEINLILRESSDERKRGILVPKLGPAVSKSGDIWLLGSHRLVCGSSSEAESYQAVDAAIRRWQKYTGDRAIHGTSGKCFDEVVPHRR